MFTHNPFAELAASVPSGAIQAFVIVMIILVIAGTLFDVIHKKSAQYFFENMQREQENGRRKVSGGEMAGMAVKTLAVEVATSAEFCNPNRRIAHLMTMWGFVAHVAGTVAMAIGGAEGGIWAMLWHLGALSVAIGGFWFWFFIRADVSAEGQSPFRVMRADLFVLSLLGTNTFALLWSWTQGSGMGWFFFALYVISALVLFGGVPWSKFAHMFFKPAAALQKRVTKADGSKENLPDLGELNDPELQERYPDIPMYMGENPPNMGLGIKRESPNHY
ncbi:MAG: adenylyl-sulfate reductase [Pseudomonadota bacterium]